jgi:hypothetical protein
MYYRYIHYILYYRYILLYTIGIPISKAPKHKNNTKKLQIVNICCKRSIEPLVFKYTIGMYIPIVHTIYTYILYYSLLLLHYIL